jgi:hypothetical protein
MYKTTDCVRSVTAVLEREQIKYNTITDGRKEMIPIISQMEEKK